MDTDTPAIEPTAHPPATQRYRLTIAYDGTLFHGWQKQCPPDKAPLRTVCGVIEARLAQLLHQQISLIGASRTDARVHARGQVAHFDAVCPIPIERLAKAINGKLPDDVEILDARIAAPDFDAIQGAKRKQYRYRIHASEKRPLDKRFVVWHCWEPLDFDRMVEAAPRIEGTHDFAGFASAGHGRDNTVRTVFRCHVERPLAFEPEIHFIVEGSGFLWNMVRIIVGTLYEIGRGRYDASRIDEIIATGDRRLAGRTMPPEGLRLEWIEYEGETGEMPNGRMPIAE